MQQLYSIDEPSYWQNIEAVQAKAKANGWLVRYCVEYDEPSDYEHMVDPTLALARYHELLQDGQRSIECYAELIEPQALDIIEPLTLLQPPWIREKKRIPRELRYLQETLQRRIGDLNSLLLAPPSFKSEMRWEEAEKLCPILHELIDQIQRNIVEQAELPMMSAAQTVGPIPCVFAASSADRSWPLHYINKGEITQPMLQEHSDRLAVFVPASVTTPIASIIVRGSAIVGKAGSDEAERVTTIDYEGSIYGPSANVKTYADRARRATGRQSVAYPTIARSVVFRRELRQVGWYDTQIGITLFDGMEEEVASWLGVEELDPRELRFSGL